MVFEQLVRCGYPSSSLHGGKEQEDRDSTLADFKRADGPSVLVATSVAGRGLDVRSVGCVINYSAPNHLEDYVHRVGRTGRADETGIAYTLVNSGDEAKFAPNIVRAMIEAGHAANISPELRELADEFKSRVERGEAKYAGSGFKGNKGYSFDSSEKTEAQKLEHMTKRQAMIEAGMMDPDEFDPAVGTDEIVTGNDPESNMNTAPRSTNSAGALAKIKPNLTEDVLNLPGMREAIMVKAGIEPPPDQGATGGGTLSTGSNHFVEEIEINAYPREARWKVTQKETTMRLQD